MKWDKFTISCLTVIVLASVLALLIMVLGGCATTLPQPAIARDDRATIALERMADSLDKIEGEIISVFKALNIGSRYPR